jgi:hypothetical protein
MDRHLQSCRAEGPRPPRTGTRRGAVLIVAMLVAALIAVVLGSYLSLNLNTTRLAHRAFHARAALNLAEAGTEEGVWSFNQATAGRGDAWDGWSTDGTGAAWRNFTNFQFTANTTGAVKVYVDNRTPPTGTNPKVVALATVSPPGAAPVTKMIEVTLRRRSWFAAGLVARRTLTFSGTNANVDSWISDPDHDPATAAVPYSAAVRRDHGTIASADVSNNAVLLNQAHIWGYVATGGGQPQIGSQGTVQGAGTPANVAVDSSRITTDFSAEFNLLSAPVDGTLLASVGATLGTAGTATRWRVPSISLSGSQTLTILGDVTLVMTAGSGTTAISVAGNAAINVPAGSSLTIYTEANLRIAGNSVANANAQPIACTIFGTNQTLGGQDFQISGNGNLRTSVYAPNADVRLVGNGDIMGSVVARDITLTGNASFHYDESLADSGTTTPYTISRWREVQSAADQAAYLGRFQGW